MTDEEFERRLAELRSAVRTIVAVLDEVGEPSWRTWFADVQRRLDRFDQTAFDRALMAFGGMGSFNDLVIHPDNHHLVERDRIDEVNQRLAELRGVVHHEAHELRRVVRRPSSSGGSRPDSLLTDDGPASSA